MEILEVRRRSGALLEQLLELWERSVRASHTFLSPAEIAAIRPDVPGALAQVPHLVIARERETPLGFLGAEGRRSRRPGAGGSVPPWSGTPWTPTPCGR